MLQRSWVGRRVSVRRVLDREAEGRLAFGDVVGDLVGLDAQTAVIDARDGLVEVRLDRIAAARLAPPSTADELELERIVAAGWRAEHTDQVGGWLLRASGGFTGRGNSVLPLRAPGMPLDAALEQLSSWYAQHGLPPKFQVPTEARRLLDAELAERGWPASADVHVMAARLDVLSTAAPAHDVSLEPAPDESWLRRFRAGAGVQPAARALLTRHDHVVFAAVRAADGTALTIGRGTVDDGWLGVTAVEVAPENRRAGLATSVMRALWQWGRAEGAVRTHLEVSSDNDAALAFYEGLGYWVHHDYRYRTAPTR